MARTGLGALCAAAVLFAFGMLYWAGNPLPYASWKRTNGDEAAGLALKQHFPVSGTYYLPGSHHDAETRERLHEAGPVGFVHLTARDGRPAMETGIFVRGFVLNLAVALLLAAMLRTAALPTYARRARLMALGALAAAVLVDGGDVVWWYIPLEWKIHQGLYSFGAWLVTGLVLAALVKPDSGAEQRAD